MSKTATDPRQMELILPELCFPGQNTITANDIVNLLGVTLRHVIDHLHDPDSPLIAIDTGRKENRGNYRIPVTSYYAWLNSCLTGQPAENPILQLKTQVLINLFRNIANRLQVRGEHPLKLIKNI